MSLLEQVAARARALLSAETDQALVRARTDGEKLVAALRLGFIVLFSAVVIVDGVSAETVRLTAAVIALAVGYGTAMLLLASRLHRPWVPWMSSAVDVTLISVSLTSFALAGDPVGALNNRVLFETYFFAIVTATLRYDWRLSAFAALLAIGEFLGLTAWVTHRWQLSDLQSFSGRFVPVSHALRILLLAAVGVSSAAVARWARHLRLMVGTDHLTGLSQRRPFFERLEEELQRSTSDRKTLSIALFDVDEFKRFNDTHGHLSGDRALQLLAARLRTLVRTTDLVARFGGEEFVVAFPRLDVERAVRRVNELRAELAEVHIPVAGAVRHLTMSAGVGSWPADGETFEDVLAKVDERLYQAKQEGRNRVIGPRSHLRTAVDG